MNTMNYWANEHAQIKNTVDFSSDLEHCKVSIKFAIELLESFDTVDVNGIAESETGGVQIDHCGKITNKYYGDFVNSEDLINKIKELKTYLNE